MSAALGFSDYRRMCLDVYEYGTPEEIAEFDAIVAADTDDTYWAEEWDRCASSCRYFLDTWVWIYDKETRRWLPFSLWPKQSEALDVLGTWRKAVMLKARQVGFSWLCLGKLLHETQFHPIQTAQVFSFRESDAMYLVGSERLKGMWQRLPVRLRSSIVKDNEKHLAFANGSHVRAFPTSAGDSYAATSALVDEADLVPDLETLLGRIEPSLGERGRLVLISRANKKLPLSGFKQIYKAARDGEIDWGAYFMPWYEHPDRDEAWYEAMRRHYLATEGSLDTLHEQFPATDVEALSPNSLGQRLPTEWIEACRARLAPLDLTRIETPIDPEVLGRASAHPELVVYRLPEAGRAYVVGVDPAEGLPTGCDSSAHVLDRETGEEVARLCGKLEPKRAFPGALADVAEFFNGAAILVERNNHGHAVIAGLEARGARLVEGRDERPGWPQSELGKVEMYDTAADQLRNREVTIHSEATVEQLASIDRNKLKAPPEFYDDQATSFALACVARRVSETPRREFFVVT